MLLGRKVDALPLQDVARWAFGIRSGVASKVVVECPSKGSSLDLVYPEQVAAMLLSTIKHRAEGFIGKRVTGAVVTVPAGYNRTQRQSLRDACQIAGLHAEQLVISSTASAVAHADSVVDAAATIFEKKIVIVDYGGGSLNITLVRVRVNHTKDGAEVSFSGIEVQVEATAGNLESGEVLSDRLFEHFRNEIGTASTIAGPSFSRRLRRAFVLAQKILSTSQQASIDLPPWQPRRGIRSSGVFNGLVDGFRSTISRADFESLCGTEVWNRLPNMVDQVFKRAKVKKEDVDAILVTGGAMQVPKLREVLGECFAEHWNRIVDLPKHTAAIGAALIAAQKGRHLLKTEPTPLSLGIRSASGDTLVVVPPSTPLPAQQTRMYYASCQNEIAFDILEGLLDPEQDGSGSPAATSSKLEHCMGRVLIDGSRASAPLILKLEIAFEVDTADNLTVVISDKSNDRVTRLQLAGDETCLSAEAISLAQAHLSEMLNNTAAADETKSPSFSSALTMSLQDAAIVSEVDILRACVNKLKPMMQTNSFSVCIPPGDLFLLHSKIENARTGLEQITSSQQSANQEQLHTAREYLRQIHLLHLLSTASSTLAQLRQELNLDN